MKRNGIEQVLVIFLFVLVLVIFSFAERDSKKLDRLYNTTYLLQKKLQVQQTAQRSSAAVKFVK